VRQLHHEISILGVCLGHQIITEALGAKIARAPEPIHGRASIIEHSESGIFAGLPNPLSVGRYHSLVVEESSLPAELEVTARTPDGIVMAIAHRALPIVGLQFHPESILTECGYEILAGFLRLAGANVPDRLPTPADEESIIASQFKSN
jgi:anthranilate synthase/aminodeoxychorismate synthase-like glutamine amidotransferase